MLFTIKFGNICISSRINKFEKCASERTDDIIHSTQNNIKYINRAIICSTYHKNLAGYQFYRKTPLQIYEIWLPW